MSAIQNDFRRLVKRAMGEHPMSPVGAPKWNTTVANSAPTASSMPKPLPGQPGSLGHGTGLMSQHSGPVDVQQSWGHKAIEGYGKASDPGGFIDKTMDPANDGAYGRALTRSTGMPSWLGDTLAAPIDMPAMATRFFANQIGRGAARVYEAVANPDNTADTGLQRIGHGAAGVGQIATAPAMALGLSYLPSVASAANPLLASGVTGAVGTGIVGAEGELTANGVLNAGQAAYKGLTSPARPPTEVASAAERGVKAAQPPSPDGANWGEIIPSLMQMFAQMAGGMGGAGGGQQPGGSPGDYLSQFAGNVNPAMQVAMSNPYVPRT